VPEIEIKNQKSKIKNQKSKTPITHHSLYFLLRGRGNRLVTSSPFKGESLSPLSSPLEGEGGVRGRTLTFGFIFGCN